MKYKSIDAFVRSSIKADADSPDIGELQRLLDEMSTTEMQQFWMRFAAGRAFSTASASVPHWKTKEGAICFRHELIDWIFYPKERDAKGKCIVVRSDLEQHVKSYLLKHIEDKRRFEAEFRASPLFDRIHARIGFTIVVLAYMAIPIGISLILINAIFHVSLFATIANPALFVFVALYALYLLMPILRLLLRKCNLWKDTQ